MAKTSIKLPEGFVLDEPNLPEGFVLDEPVYPPTIADPQDVPRGMFAPAETKPRVGTRPLFPKGTPRDIRPPSQRIKPKRSRWEEFIDAETRGLLRVGSAGAQALASMREMPPMTGAGMRPQEPLSLPQIQKNMEAARKNEKTAQFLWELSKDPGIAAQNKDLASKALNLIGETVPYITATTAAYIVAGPVGGFTVGSLVEGNSAYRVALDAGVPEDKARKIGVGVGLISGAVEAFGGRFAEDLLLRATAKLRSKILKAGAVFTVGTVVEALEEGAQEIAQITGEKTYRDVSWKEGVNRTLGSMAGGAFLGGTMRVGSMSGKGILFGNEQPWTATLQEVETFKEKAEKGTFAEIDKAVRSRKEVAEFEAEIARMDAGIAEKPPVRPTEAITPEIPPTEPAKPEVAEKPAEVKVGIPPEQQKALDDFLGHIETPSKPTRGKPGFVIVPEAVAKAGQRAKIATQNIKGDLDKFRFYPKAPPEFRNAVRIDLVGALTKATKNVYQDAQQAIWGDVNKKDVRKSVEILYARDQLSRTKRGKGNPEIDLEEASGFLDDALTDASPEAIAAADRFKAIHDKYTNKLIERGVLAEGDRIEDHVHHYVEDYTPEWAPYANIPARLKRPFRGYAKRAFGTTKEYRQDQEALLSSLMEMEHHNLVEDFIETQVKKYDVKPSLAKEVRRKMFGTDARGYALVPRPGKIYIHEGKRYRAYTPDIPFSRAIYLTEGGEAALGSFKNVALIPEDMYNLFRDFSQRGSRAVYLLNRATGYWKTMAILAHFPSFNVNNFVGDTWVAMTQHPAPTQLLSEYDTAIRYLTKESKPKSGYFKQLEDFIIKHDIKQTFAQAELAVGRKAKNPIAWVLRKSYAFSDKRESINRVAYASSLLKANQRGDGAKMVEAHDWIDTEGLSTEDALGKISRDVLVDYQAQSKSFRRFVRGGIAPFGTWYFKMSRTIWKWLSKHPFKATLAFTALPLAAAGYNRRRKEIQELEMQLPDYVRNRVHFVFGENPDGTVRVLSLQLPQDVLIGTKIFSIVVDHSNRVINGEMTPKEAAIETMKTWGIREYEGAKYLLTPWIRMYSGLKSGKDPYDKAPVYRRDYNKMTWDEKATDIAAYIVKTSIPFLGATIQTYEKGLPQDIALKKLADRWAGKGAFGIYDMNKKGQVMLGAEGKKVPFEWKDIHRIRKLVAQEYKYLGRLEDDFVASEQKPAEFLASPKAKASLLKLYSVWAKQLPELKKEKSSDTRIRIVVSSLGERLTNRVSKPRILQKWYQVKIARAKTADEKRQIAKDYAIIKKQRLIEALKAQPKTSREIYLIGKIKKLQAEEETVPKPKKEKPLFRKKTG